MSFVVTLQESKLVFVFFRSFVFHFDSFLSFSRCLQPPNQVIDFDSDSDFDFDADAGLPPRDM